MQDNSNHLSTLIPYIILGIFPGIINAYNAWQKFKKKSRLYIFFQPLRTFLFWVWLFIHILVPALIYWWLFITTCVEKPNIDLNFFFKVLIYGICFSSLFTNIEKMALIPVNLSILVDWINNLLEDNLRSKQRVKTANFWSGLQQELEKLKPRNLSKGLDYLENYYFVPPLYEKEECTKLQNRLSEIRQERDRKSKCKRLVNQCFKGIIPRQDLPEILKEFKLSPEENKYF
ncbi:hypothetical protein [Crocosphaera sp.]|uniref:hypothetical protein n=1 Tax=Crocosphaera sp. TaxID=2729996 RepID=UPI0026031667|nr:hypothetical protein [Crocosphaera sp.]MDJ0579533.1 hypothetical protein [Crocosphaera sp.]